MKPIDQLRQVDIADMNLASASGLPGSEWMDADFCRYRLERFAEHVKNETQRAMPKFRRNPEEYEHSEPLFRMLTLTTVLVQDFGVRYNLAKASRDTMLMPEDSFIFGVFQGEGGNCGSLPVVFISVGRRLGYPLKLATTRGHSFIRWEGADGTKFNFEAHQQGMAWHSDEYYRKWPVELLKQEIECFGYLRSLRPEEELAHFLGERGLYWLEIGCMREAIECFAWAAELESFDLNAVRFCQYLDQWKQQVRVRRPPGFPKVTIGYPTQRFKRMPMSKEIDFAFVCCVDGILNDSESDARWWRHLREGHKPESVGVPNHIHVRVEESFDFDNSYYWNHR